MQRKNYELSLTSETICSNQRTGGILVRSSVCEMEGIMQGLRSLTNESKTSVDGASYSSPAVSLDQPAVLVPRSHGYTVSLSTCSKLCAVGFIAGVIVGYTLKKRVRRWTSKVLKRLRDD